MIIQFRIRGLNATASLRAWLEQQLEGLHSLTPVSIADVRLERREGTSPAIQAYVHLAIAGPDIHATACDHTSQAVWLKVIKNLKRQIEGRKAKQEARHKRTSEVRGVANRGSGAGVGARG